MKKIELKNLKEQDLFYFGERVEPYFVTSLTIPGMQNVKKSIKLFSIKSAIRWLQINDYLYQFVSDLKEIEKEITKKLKHANGDYVDHLIEGCLKAGEELQKKSADFGRTARNLTTREEMAEAILEYEKAVHDYTIYYQITFFERPVMRLGQEIVRKYAKNKPASRQFFNFISTPNRLTAVEFEQDDFLRMALRSKEEKEILAEKHAKKYGWLSIRYFSGKAWTKNDVLIRLKSVNRNWAKLELKKKLSHRREREILISEAIKKFSSKDKKIVRQIRQLVFLRTQRGDYFNETAYHIRPLLKKIATELNISYADLLHLPTKEMVLALQGKIDYLEIIKKRKRNFLIYHDFGRREVLVGDEVIAFLDSHPFLKINTENVAEFTGQIGYEGRVEGKIKVVKINQDIRKVRKGDILVTNMTTANFLPAMEKASAFITDEGGILCHAAIIAREMKKPCIIGTKIATKVLRDGDLVEVDADRGVVKIIKKR